MNELIEAAAQVPVQEEAPQAETPFTPAQMQAVLQAVSDAVAAHQAAASKEAQQKEEHFAETENALSQREAAIREREMRAFAREQLLRRSLPEALLDALCCRDEESCIESLDKVETAFRQAVQEGVLERMRGEEPRRTAAPSLAALDDQAYYTATYQK